MQHLLSVNVIVHQSPLQEDTRLVSDLHNPGDTYVSLSSWSVEQEMLYNAN